MPSLPKGLITGVTARIDLADRTPVHMQQRTPPAQFRPSAAAEPIRSIVFSVPAVPVAQPRQRHRIVDAGDKQFVQNYTPTRDAVNAFKAAVQLAFSEAYQGPPLDGPVSLEVEFVMPRPKALVWKNKPMPRVWHAKKPDTDNLLKSLKDALSKLAWSDDAQVALVLAHKHIAAGDEQPHARVRVNPLLHGGF